MSTRRTDHGFQWGNAEVVCLFENYGHRWLEIKTPRETLEIRVTPTGLLRIRTKGAVSASSTGGMGGEP